MYRRGRREMLSKKIHALSNRIKCRPFPDRRDRRNPRHPQVGRARAPDIANARSKLDRKPDPKEERRREERKGSRLKF